MNPTSSRAFRLLLVEDNQGDADLMSERLNSIAEHPYRLNHVATLQDAISAPPADAVLLDLNLPDSTGIETLRRFRFHRPDVPVVVLSGSRDVNLRHLARREGAQDFIGKDEPVSLLLARTILYAAERYRISEQRRQAERLVLANPDATIVADLRGNVRFVNEAAVELFGRPRDDFIGGKFGFDLQVGGVTRIEFERWTEPLTAEMRVVEFEWEGEPALLAAIRDMTAQKELQEQLLQAQKMEAIGRLAGGIAHDFNNLLTVIMNYAGFVRNALDAGDSRRADLDEVLDAAGRAAALTSQLLAFSRQRPLHADIVDPSEVLDRFHRIVTRTLSADIEIDCALDSGLWPVYVDAVQLEQVLMNLAINARDAMSAGGRITIQASNVPQAAATETLQAGDYVAISIADNGAGIAPEHIESIFEPFFTTKDPGKGTGLGLSMCYGIVRQANGDLLVDSAQGIGTTFTVMLPRAPVAVEEVTQHTTSQAARLRGTETIVIVEDDPGVRQSTARILREHGYGAIEVENAKQALDAVLESNDARLVLADIVMPGMGGRRLAEQISIVRPDLHVLLMTGYPEQEAPEPSLPGQAPLPDILAKPYTPIDLLRRIRQILDS